MGRTRHTRKRQHVVPRNPWIIFTAGYNSRIFDDIETFISGKWYRCTNIIIHDTIKEENHILHKRFWSTKKKKFKELYINGHIVNPKTIYLKKIISLLKILNDEKYDIPRIESICDQVINGFCYTGEPDDPYDDPK